MRRALPAITLTTIGVGALLQFKTTPSFGSTTATTREAAGNSQPATPATVASTPDTVKGAIPVPANAASGTATTKAATTTGAGVATTKPAVAAAGAAGPITKTGPVVNTRYGPVQVKITMTNGKITASDAIQSPNDRSKSVAINSHAVPVLNAEALKAQSAQIDTVGGATITSHGYQQSLQAAIDAARAG